MHTTGRLIPTLLAAAAAVLCAPGCDRPAAQGAGAAQSDGRPKVNVVLFLIDTLRADHVGAYGYPQPTTPNIDALARQGVVFENAHAPAPWTLPSLPSIHTSTFPCEHGVVSDGHKISPDLPTLAERFQRLGYYTVSLWVNNWAGPATNMHRGFDVCENPNPRGGFVDGRQVVQALQKRPGTPFFLSVHNLEPHNPHRARPEYIRLFGNVASETRRRLGALLRGRYNELLRADFDRKQPLGTTDNTTEQDALLAEVHSLLGEHLILYDAVVREADKRVGSVVAALRELGVWDETLFIVLSDHGEEFNDHGAYLHSQSVYQELAHVPLVLRFPRNEFAGRRIPDVISLIDVLPTIFDYLGRPDLIGPARGQTLLPLVRGQHRPADEWVVTTVRMNYKKYYRPWARTRGQMNVAARRGNWKGIWNDELKSVELYDLSADPGEKSNLAAARPDLAQAVRQTLEPWFAACLSTKRDAGRGDVRDLPEEDVRGLQKLGYIGSQPAGDEDEEP